MKVSELRWLCEIQGTDPEMYVSDGASGVFPITEVMVPPKGKALLFYQRPLPPEANKEADRDPIIPSPVPCAPPPSGEMP